MSFPATIVAWLTMLIASSAQAQSPAAVAAPQSAAAAVAALEDAARFDVLDFEVEGNTRLDALVVERAVLPHMGPQRRLADVDAARAALEKAYQDAGYLTVLVDLPEQRVTDGLVRLRVTEGRIDRVRVTGARFYSQGHIRAVASAFQEGEVPDFNRAQAQLAALNRGANRQVQPVLRPGLVPGTVEVELKVRDALPLSTSLVLHNQHAAHTDALRLSATLRYDNLLQRDHGIALTLSTAPRAPQQTQVANLSYTVPGSGLGGSGGWLSAWTATLTHSNSAVEPLGNTVLGRGSTVGLRWTTALATPTANHSLSLGGEWRDLQQRVRPGADAAGEVSTPVRYLPFSLGYSGQWWHAGEPGADNSGPPASSRLEARLAFGLRGLLRRSLFCGNFVQDQFDCNRNGADGGFATLRLEGEHTLATPLGLPGRLTLRATAQLAAQPLISGEQLTLGGADSVRGYYEAEASGDLGLVGGLQWDSPNLAGTAGRWLSWPDSPGLRLRELVALGFVDLGRVQVIDPQAGQNARSALAGAGFGLRLVAGSASGALDLAWPLKASNASPERRPRLHARVTLSF